MDLLLYIKEKIPVSAVESISSFLGENPHDTAVAIDNLLPFILAEISNKASGAGKDIINELAVQTPNENLLENIDTLFDDSTKTLQTVLAGVKQANNLVGGAKIGDIIEKVSTQTNIKKTSIGSLVGISTPLVLQAWKDVSSNLTQNDLSLFIDEQKQNAKNQMPSYLLGSLETPIEKRVDAAPSETPLEMVDNNTIGGGEKKKNGFSVFPWVLAGLFGLGALFLFKNYKPTLNWINQKIFPNALTDSLTTLQDTLRDITKSPLAKDFVKPKEAKTYQNNSLKGYSETNSGKTVANDNQIDGHIRRGLESGTGNWVAFSSKNSNAIDQIAAFLSANPNAKIRVAGEFYKEAFDSGCSIRSRKKSSFNNACRVKTNLNKKGIPNNQIEVGTTERAFKNGNVAVKVL